MFENILTPQILQTTPAYIKKLNEMGIKTVHDMLFYFPRTYEDRSQVRKIHEIHVREKNTIEGKINAIEKLITMHRKNIIRAEIEDRMGNIAEIIWFNQPHILQKVIADQWYRIYGTVKYEFGKIQFLSPEIESVKEKHIPIVPVYAEYDTGKKKSGIAIHSDWFTKKMRLVIQYADQVAEFLPQEILKQEKLENINSALKHIHFPKNKENAEKAQYRFVFQEMFLLQLQALKKIYAYREKSAKQGKSMPLHIDKIKNCIDTLPFQLTDSQKIVVYQILKDMEKNIPMIRLLQGDVGSGKTVVAAICAYHVLISGYQVAFVVPTEILAQQHTKTLNNFLKPLGYEAICLTGSLKDKEKKDIAQQLKNGNIKCVVGTHALLQEHIEFYSLGFAIIDEQHRFGVEQRKKLAFLGSPHILHMTATPIPRTLALTLYGDQDISILSTVPQGRLPVITKVISEEKRQDAYRFIESEIIKGRQVYVICPLIEGSENLDFKAVTEEYERLSQEVFAQYSIGLLHGKMSAEEKQNIMQNFQAGKIQILVSTTVIEVGIDVKNATIMMIEGADRFGLSQLHQLRGRVGRNDLQSYCFLFPSKKEKMYQERLKAMEKTNDGFKLAEMDLNLRGSGEIYGQQQSGFFEIPFPYVLDARLIEKARNLAEQILEKDPTLSQYPGLADKIPQESKDFIIS